MILSKRQNNPIVVDEKPITIDEDALNVYFLSCGCVVDADMVKHYVSIEKSLDENAYKNMTSLFSETEINKCVVSQIKDEFGECWSQAMNDVEQYKKGIITEYAKHMLEMDAAGELA